MQLCRHCQERPAQDSPYCRPHCRRAAAAAARQDAKTDWLRARIVQDLICNGWSAREELRRRAGLEMQAAPEHLHWQLPVVAVQDLAAGVKNASRQNAVGACSGKANCSVNQGLDGLF